MTQEQSILKAKSEFDQMVTAIRKAVEQGQRIDLVEPDLWQRMLEMSRLILQGFVDLQGHGDLGATLEYEGHSLNRLEKLHDRRYVSVFGELLISRVVYGTRETQKHDFIPLDARLCLPETDFSYLLQEWEQSFCVQGSYAKSSQSIDRILSIGQSIHSLEDMNRFMGRDVGDCRHLVKDRMELTGMRWQTDGAQAMLDLRSVFLNDDWEAFQQYRIETNNRKLYPSRELIEAKWNVAA